MRDGSGSNSLGVGNSTSVDEKASKPYCCFLMREKQIW